MKGKIICVFGTRPEAIKLAPLILELKRKNIKTIVVSTGQHKEMLKQVLSAFDIKADYKLDVMKKNHTLIYVTQSILSKFSRVLEREKPDLVVLQGDTATAFICALTSFYYKVPIAHVEAGLRTYLKYAPFPEEISRRLIDHISDIYFPPTKLAMNNLIKEGINKKNIFITGNTGIDALFYIKNKKLPFMEKTLRKINFHKNKVIVATIHRREHFGKPLENICDAILKVAKREKDVSFVIPVHMNPNVRNIVYTKLGNIKNVYLTNPLFYTDFVNLMAKSYFIITDSGGVQEEAPYLAKPVLVLRVATERREAVISGTIKVVGFNKQRVVREILTLLHSKKVYNRMSRCKKPFGDGKASVKIVDVILKLFNKKVH